MKLVKPIDAADLNKQRLILQDDIKKTISAFKFISGVGVCLNIGIPIYYKNTDFRDVLLVGATPERIQIANWLHDCDDLTFGFLVDSKNAAIGRDVNEWLETAIAQNDIFKPSGISALTIPIFGGACFLYIKAGDFRATIELMLQNYPKWAKFNAIWEKRKLTRREAAVLSNSLKKANAIEAL